VVIKGFILFRRTPEQADFLRIEHPADECVALFPVFSELVCSDGPLAIIEGSFQNFSSSAGARKDGQTPTIGEVVELLREAA